MARKEIASKAEKEHIEKMATEIAKNLEGIMNCADNLPDGGIIYLNENYATITFYSTGWEIIVTKKGKVSLRYSFSEDVVNPEADHDEGEQDE